MRMSGMCGMELQKHLQREGVDLPVIIITGYGDVPTAVQAMRSGALTFLEKPCDDQLLWESICLALEKQATSRAQRAAAKPNSLPVSHADPGRVRGAEKVDGRKSE